MEPLFSGFKIEKVYYTHKRHLEWNNAKIKWKLDEIVATY